MNDILKKLGNKFASLTRVTFGKSFRTSWLAESVWLKGGHHFMCEGDTPKEALKELLKQTKDLEVL